MVNKFSQRKEKINMNTSIKNNMDMFSVKNAVDNLKRAIESIEQGDLSDAILFTRRALGFLDFAKHSIEVDYYTHRDVTVGKMNIFIVLKRAIKAAEKGRIGEAIFFTELALDIFDATTIAYYMLSTNGFVNENSESDKGC
jgi:hypothetical protein